MGQADAGVVGQLILLFIHGGEGAVLHVAEGGLEPALLIYAPDQAHGELVHNGVVDKQGPPAVAGPAAQYGKGFLQPGLLGGGGGADLLLHGLEVAVGGGGLGRVVGLAGDGQGFEGLAAVAGDLQLQGGGQPHGKGAGAIVKDPLAVGGEAQGGHHPVGQLLQGNAQLLGGVLQGGPGGGLHLAELELAGDTVHRQQGGGIAAEGQGGHRVAGNGPPGVLWPLVDGVGQLGDHGRAAVYRREGEHPLGLVLGPGSQPALIYLIGQGGQVLLVDPLGQLGGGLAAADPAQLAVGHQQGVPAVLTDLAAPGQVEGGQGAVQQPLDFPPFSTLQNSVGQPVQVGGGIFTGGRGPLIQGGLNGVGHLGVLFHRQGRLQLRAEGAS